MVTTNDDVKGNVFMEFGSSCSKMSEDEIYVDYEPTPYIDYSSKEEKAISTVSYWTSSNVPKNVDGTQGKVVYTIPQTLGGSITTKYIDTTDSAMSSINVSLQEEDNSYVLWSYMNLPLNNVGQTSIRLGAMDYDLKVSTNASSQGRAKISHIYNVK